MFLEGLPNLQNLGKLMIGEDVAEALQCDLKLVLAARPDLQVAIAHCETVKDYISRDLQAHVLESETVRIDLLETQLELVTRIRAANYQQSQVSPPSGS